MKKRGRLGVDEIDFIKINHPRLTAEQIGERLERTEECVKKAITEHCRPGASTPKEDAERIEIKQSLRASQSWKQLKRELADEDEVQFFEEQYIGLMTQFRGDVLHTEEAQIFDAIKLEILKHRNLTARKKAVEEIKEHETWIDDFKRANPDMNEVKENKRAIYLARQTQL